MEEEKSALENLTEPDDRDSLNQDSEEEKKSALENLMELHDQDSEEDEEEFFFWTHESPDINISKEFLANIFFMVPTAFVFMLSIIIFFSGFR